MQSEVWKDVIGYKGLYMVSNLGRFKSLDRFTLWKFGKKRIFRGKMMKASLKKTGYLNIQLCKNGIRKTINAHRIVGLAFIMNPQNKGDINHKNGIKKDNRVVNLEWMTRGENIRHAFATGLRGNRRTKKLKI